VEVFGFQNNCSNTHNRENGLVQKDEQSNKRTKGKRKQKCPGIKVIKEDTQGYAVVVGAVTSNSNLMENLLEDLVTISTELEMLKQSKSKLVYSIDVFVLENGPVTKQSHEALCDVIENVKTMHGLRCTLIPMHQMLDDLPFMPFPPSFLPCFSPSLDFPSLFSTQLPIAISRTALQWYISHVCADMKSCGVKTAVFILDDDKRINTRFVLRGLRTHQANQDLEALFGVDEGAPPSPGLFVLRTSLVDLYHAAHRFLNGALLQPHGFGINQDISHKCPCHYHYDVSDQRYIQLESPYAFPIRDSSLGEMLAEHFSFLLRGESKTRRVKVNSKQGSDVEKNSCLRGGVSLMFGEAIESFKHIPNVSTVVEGRVSRRSDMVWALLFQRFGKDNKKPSSAGTNGSVISGKDRKTNKEKSKRRAEKKNNRKCQTALCLDLKVTHDRSSSSRQSIQSQISVVVKDINGFATYRALKKCFSKGTCKQGEPLPPAEFFVKQFTYFLTKRTEAVLLSLLRIRGLLNCIHSLLTQFPENTDEDSLSLLFTLSDLASIRTWELVLKKNLQSAKSDTSSLVDWYHEVTKQTSHTQQQTAQVNTFAAQLWKTHREQNAMATLNFLLRKNSLEPISDNFLLQINQQELTVVEKDEGKRCFNLLDVLTSMKGKSRIECLKNVSNIICSNPFPTVLLGAPKKVLENGHFVTAFESFQEDSRKKYGTWINKKKVKIQTSSLVDVLVSCANTGLVCRNLMSKHLEVSTSSPRTITGIRFCMDLDVVPSNKIYFSNMMARVFLMGKWSHRNDLDSFLLSSSALDVLPELSGFNFFCQHVQEKMQDSVKDKISKGISKMLKVVLEDPPFPKRGVLIISDESDKEFEGMIKKVLKANNKPRNPVTWTTLAELLEMKKTKNNHQVDLVVVSGLLLSSLDDQKLMQVLSCLASSVSSVGKMLAAVINPFFEEPQVSGIMPNQRNFHSLHRLFLKSGWSLDINQVSEILQNNFDDQNFLAVTVVATVLNLNHKLPKASLLITVCCMEAKTVFSQVEHIVTQLETNPGQHIPFWNRILLLDGNESSFQRQYTEGDMKAAIQECQLLVDCGYIDKFVICTNDSKSIYKDWFTSDVAFHSEHGSIMGVFFVGMSACDDDVDVLLHLDGDIMIARSPNSHGQHDFLEEALRVFKDDQRAITLSLNIYHKTRSFMEYTKTYMGTDKPFRTESRAGFIHIKRIKEHFPLSLPPKGTFHATLGWEGIVDNLISSTNSLSLRGGSCELCFIHPENQPYKKDPQSLLMILDRIETNNVPAFQDNKVNLQGTLKQWLRDEERREDFVFVVCGKNVTLSLMRRCIESIAMQTKKNWGAVIIDDAPTRDKFSYSRRMYLRKYIKQLGISHKCTVLCPRLRRGPLANLSSAVKDVCVNPMSVIITLDMDDHLVRDDALELLEEFYFRQRVWVTVGSMLRTDKATREESSYPVCFCLPRSKRGGGNVWLHLRSFYKFLFDRVHDRDLRDPQGEYYDLAADWAYMLPIVEQATRYKCGFINEILYYYSPSDFAIQGDFNNRREKVIDEIVSKPPYKPLRRVVAVIGDANIDRSSQAEALERNSFELGYLLHKKGFSIMTGGMKGVMEQVARGFSKAHKELCGTTSCSCCCGVSIGVLPRGAGDANPFLDVAVPTNLGEGRNSVVVGGSTAVIGIGGGSGTLSELALATSFRRLRIVITGCGGSTAPYAGLPLDARDASRGCVVFSAPDPASALAILETHFDSYLFDSPISTL